MLTVVETTTPKSTSKVTTLHTTSMVMGVSASCVEMMTGALATADFTARATMLTAPPGHFVEQLADASWLTGLGATKKSDGVAAVLVSLRASSLLMVLVEGAWSSVGGELAVGSSTARIHPRSSASSVPSERPGASVPDGGVGQRRAELGGGAPQIGVERGGGGKPCAGRGRCACRMVVPALQWGRGGAGGPAAGAGVGRSPGAAEEEAPLELGRRGVGGYAGAGWGASRDAGRWDGGRRRWTVGEAAPMGRGGDGRRGSLAVYGIRNFGCRDGGWEEEVESEGMGRPRRFSGQGGVRTRRG